MALTGSIVGRETIAYFKQAATWGIEATPGAGMLLMEDGMEFDQTLDPLEENDSTFLKENDLGTRTAAFNFKQSLRFDDMRGIAMVLGDGAYTTPITAENAGKGDFLHTVLPAPDNFGDFATMAIKKGDIIQSFPSVKYAGFTLTGQASPNRFEVSVNTFADNLLNASTVITANSFTDLSKPSGNGGRGFFRNFTVELNDQSAASLTGTADGITNAVTSVEWSVQRALAADYTNTSGLNIEEPVEDAYLESTITLQLRNLDSLVDGLYTDLINKTAKKLQFTITGAAASSATGSVANARFQVDAPHALVENVDYGPYSGPGRISAAVTFRLLGAETTSDASGMAFVEPFQLQWVNAQADQAVS